MEKTKARIQQDNIRHDPNDFRNPEVFVNIAEKYRNESPVLSFISLQNADLYEADTNKREKYRTEMQKLRENGFSAPDVSIVILNYKNAEMTINCISSIKRWNSPANTEIIVVDNNSNDGSIERLARVKDIKLISNKENRGFPGGCNDGIKAADPDNDILLLNNDTLMTPNAIYTLRMALYEDESNGSAGSVQTIASNGQMVSEQFEDYNSALIYGTKNNFPDKSRHEKKIYLIGNALLIKRSVLNEIGLFDERFNPGNYEDNDMGLRILKSGHRNILCHDSFIVHLGSQSFGKEKEKYQGLLEANRQKICEKYGFNIQYYSYPRYDVMSLIDKEKDDSFKALEVGCGLGATLNSISYEYPNSECSGIELVTGVAGIGRGNGNIIEGNIEKMELDAPDGYYDYIIFADVIEHLRDPRSVLKRIKAKLAPDGRILFSIPNIMHYSVIIPLLMGSYTWDEAGIRDYTHMHSFTLTTIIEMLDDCGYKKEIVNYKLMDDSFYKTERFDWFWDLTKSGNVADAVNFEAYQYLVSASKK